MPLHASFFLWPALTGPLFTCLHLWTILGCRLGKYLRLCLCSTSHSGPSLLSQVWNHPVFFHDGTLIFQSCLTDRVMGKMEPVSCSILWSALAWRFLGRFSPHSGNWTGIVHKIWIFFPQRNKGNRCRDKHDRHPHVVTGPQRSPSSN